MYKRIVLALLIILLNATVYLMLQPRGLQEPQRPAYALILQVAIQNNRYGVMNRLRIFNTGFATLYHGMPMLAAESGEGEAGYYEGVIDPQECENLRRIFKQAETSRGPRPASATQVVWSGDGKKGSMLFKELPPAARYHLAAIREFLQERPVWTVTIETKKNDRGRPEYHLVNRGSLALTIENPWHLAGRKGIKRTRFFFELTPPDSGEPQWFNLPGSATAPKELHLPLTAQQSLILDLQPEVIGAAALDSMLQAVYEGKVKVGDGQFVTVRTESRPLDILSDSRK